MKDRYTYMDINPDLSMILEIVFSHLESEFLSPIIKISDYCNLKILRSKLIEMSSSFFCKYFKNDIILTLEFS